MPDAILIFTFSPVQPFIMEARRAADLYVGSQILVHLARAAAQAIKHQGTLIYPADLGEDVPNKIVACVDRAKVESIVKDTRAALLKEWKRIADTARRELQKTKGPAPDDTWCSIWERQTSHLWEIYWAAASMDGRSYKDAYKEASHALDAAKRTRVFEAIEEPGYKDTLSGRREALHVAGQNTLRVTRQDVRNYWTEVGRRVTAAKLRPDGRERLDAIGAVKRFCELAEKRFPSTSTVASNDFLNKARGHLADYRQSVEKLLGEHLDRVRDDQEWPYDGNLLFIETLVADRLKENYDLDNPDPQLLQEARKALQKVYKQVGCRPSPYYAIIVLDGDDMGKRVDECLEEPNPQQAHNELSRRLANFSKRVRDIAGENKNMGSVIYNGGDDVLALAPLSTALQLGQALANRFKYVTCGTASAGIAIVHYLYPLGAALRAARQAESQAKQVPNKAAVCVRVLKRSGETTQMCSPWEAIGDTFTELVKLFKGDEQGEPLSSKFAYDVIRSAYALPEADDKFQAELKRLLKRHRNDKHPQAPQPEEWAERLRDWAEKLPVKSEESRCRPATRPDDDCEEKAPGNPEMLGHWLAFARFVAQGGGE